MATEQFSKKVYLIGAGPGDPGLLTLRAVECLAETDLVIYDKLVPKRLLEWASPRARRVCVRDLESQEGHGAASVHESILAAVRRGETVARLKSGDPLVFGRGGEETALLRAAGVEYEIVPGVTAG